MAQALYQRASRLGLWALLREQATLADRDGVSGILMITSDHDIPPGEPMGDGEIVRLVPIQRRFVIGKVFGKDGCGQSAGHHTGRQRAVGQGETSHWLCFYGLRLPQVDFFIKR